MIKKKTKKIKWVEFSFLLQMQTSQASTQVVFAQDLDTLYNFLFISSTGSGPLTLAAEKFEYSLQKKQLSSSVI